jgi:hypothetical protein
MTVQDDVRRLSQMDSIFLGVTISTSPTLAISPITTWYKGRLQQANDGSWIFRSISSDGTIVGTQLGSISNNWTSGETPATGVVVSIGSATATSAMSCILQQSLPQELTN